MEILDYLESSVAETLDVLRTAYDDLHERAYKFATLLIAGGGAAGGYAFSELSKAPAKVYGWAPLAALALTWFATAAVLLWCAAAARDISAGPKIRSLQDRHRFEISKVGSDGEEALKALRIAAVEQAQKRIDRYVQACAARADGIDLAYRSAVICSPLVPTVVAVASFFLASH
jgi:hypothetical protein